MSDDGWSHEAEHQRIETRLSEQTISRAEWDEARRRISDGITDLRDRVTTLEVADKARSAQRYAIGQYYAWLIAGLSFVVSVILLVRLFVVR